MCLIRKSDESNKVKVMEEGRPQARKVRVAVGSLGLGLAAPSLLQPLRDFRQQHINSTTYDIFSFFSSLHFVLSSPLLPTSFRPYTIPRLPVLDSPAAPKAAVDPPVSPRFAGLSH
jgi:hypothetical protein